MKKIFAVTAALAMCFTLTSCGEKNSLPEDTSAIEQYIEQASETVQEEVTTTSETAVTTVETTTVTTAEITAATEKKEETVLTDEAREIYDILMSNTDIIFADGVDGINLIDLDFDCKPELFVSKYWFDNGIDWYDYDDVDIYEIDIENGCLNYIDTIYTQKRENVLGLKITDTLEAKWFLMSRITIGSGERYDRSDYLVTLSGGKLHYEEIFGYRFTRFKDGSDVPLIDPYFMDEKIDPENEKWELAKNMFNQYCSDINIVYGLCSDWLSDGENMEPLKINADTARIEIAEITANYFSNYRSGSEPIDYDYSSLFL